MRYCALALTALVLATCGDDGGDISVQLFPARLAEDPQAAPPPGWRRVQFSADEDRPALTYHVGPDTLLTEWNILAFKAAEQAGGSTAVVARLNAYGQRRLRKFSDDPANLKKPLALCVSGRWASFTPLLDQTTDRMILYGFTPEEAGRLAAYVESR